RHIDVDHGALNLLLTKKNVFNAVQFNRAARVLREDDSVANLVLRPFSRGANFALIGYFNGATWDEDAAFGLLIAGRFVTEDLDRVVVVQGVVLCWCEYLH